MLPKSRVFSVLVAGLGVALLAAGLAAPAFLEFSARMPLDLERSTWTIKDESAVSQHYSAEGIERYEGPLTYQLNLDLQDPASRESVTARVGESVMRGEGNGVEDLDSAKVWTFSMDRLSGEIEGELNLQHTLASPAVAVPSQAYWVKFPADAEQTNYPVFDPILRRPVDAVFAEESQIDGRTVYRYHQEVEPTNVAQLYAGLGTTTMLLGARPDDQPEQGYLYHSGSRDFYVDQATGMIVGLQLDIDDYYADRQGVGREQAFVFAGRTSDEDRAALLEAAAAFPQPRLASILRWIALGLGAVLFLVGLFGAFGGFTRRS